MSTSWHDYDGPRLLLAGLAVVVAVVFVYAAATSTVTFGVYNPAWDGISDVEGVAAQVGTETTVVEPTDRYGAVEPNDTVALVLSPRSSYQPAEAARIEAFVDAGGTVVVLGSPSHTNGRGHRLRVNGVTHFRSVIMTNSAQFILPFGRRSTS